MEPVKDLNIHNDIRVKELLKQFKNIGGFQAQELYRAYEILEEMFNDKEIIRVLSFPADIVATGTRGILRDLVKNKMFDLIITTCGTLDHDLARLERSYHLGYFEADDIYLKNEGVMRLGNVFIPEDNYGPAIENVLQPILKDIYTKLKEKSYYYIICPVCGEKIFDREKEGLIVKLENHLKTHSKDLSELNFKIDEENKKIIGTYELIWEIGRRLESHPKKEESIIYWSYKNKIPMIVPGITDGAVGTQILMFKTEHPDFEVSVWSDELFLSKLFFGERRIGSLMLGGGISKHHVIWWAQFSGGLEYAVYITSAVELDGSLSGAKTREAISWGKIKKEAKHVTVWGDITIILPILIAPFL
ncbi:MAG TPA: deoxyhypusine synthase [Candidatus Nanopusillus sp.]|nr:deoxyhypusine synthase [Candidatus Nanopusillus sp.]